MTTQNYLITDSLDFGAFTGGHSAWAAVTILVFSLLPPEAHPGAFTTLELGRVQTVVL
jgi:hypothetical protein